MPVIALASAVCMRSQGAATKPAKVVTVDGDEDITSADLSSVSTAAPLSQAPTTCPSRCSS
eukprot:2054272-Amphidinium_carterae.1